MEYDAFVSHASEDKDAVACPLAAHLTALGYRIWFDEFELSLGDSLRRSIDRGLASCRFGVVMLSPQFFAKNRPAYELDGLTTREQSSGQKVILPIWHGVTRDQVAAYSPTRLPILGVLPAIAPIRREFHETQGCTPSANSSEPPSHCVCRSWCPAYSDIGDAIRRYARPAGCARHA